MKKFHGHPWTVCSKNMASCPSVKRFGQRLKLQTEINQFDGFLLPTLFENDFSTVVFGSFLILPIIQINNVKMRTNAT